MKASALFILFCCFTICVYAHQNNDKKVIIIDTLTGVNYLNDFDIRICFDTNIKNHINDTFIVASVFKKHGLFSATIELHKNYKTDFFPNGKNIESVGLLFDREQGYLSLMNLWDIESDTIKIDRWDVSQNKLPDTMYRSTTFQEMINDRLIKSSNKIDTVYLKKKTKGWSNE